jgi:hypothetical protein
MKRVTAGLGDVRSKSSLTQLNGGERPADRPPASHRARPASDLGALRAKISILETRMLDLEEAVRALSDRIAELERQRAAAPNGRLPLGGQS